MHPHKITKITNLTTQSQSPAQNHQNRGNQTITILLDFTPGNKMNEEQIM